ncbi:class I SAM-dependent methyltransferase [Thalassobacillus hwangdonensis]|uniref:Class I SAM-dependent methyltransferase n=1 Tax=Thalassobacillus hwangdonensis TaxID=546108 RepID=A0ABW3L0A7_9BACI
MSEKKFNPEKADKLLTKEREEKIQPKALMDRLQISESDTIADLGAGNGFFTLPLAKRTKEKVYAVDLEPQMLDLLRQRVEEAQLKNVDYVVSDLENIDLKDDTADKLMVAFVIHEVGSIPQALSEMKRIMKKDAQVMFVEWEAVESESGPPLHHRIPSDELMKILDQEGFSAKLISMDEVYAVHAKLK